MLDSNVAYNTAVKIMKVFDGEIPLAELESHLNGITIALINFKDQMKDTLDEVGKVKVDLLVINWLKILDPGLSRYIDNERFEQDRKKVSE